MDGEIKKLEILRKSCLRDILDMCKRANAGHIASSLSCLNILIYLFICVLHKKDRVVLSKGHAAASLYVVLARTGRINESMLETFYVDGTLLAGHPPCSRKIEDIPFGTGSLGHGLSLSAGIVLAQNYTNISKRIFCIISEGDLNEGATWEALLFVNQHKLSNLIIIVDRNRQQGFGQTEDILGLDDLEAKFQSFNFDVLTVNHGNDFLELKNVFDKLELKREKSLCIIANTIKGHGISFMENNIEWHYVSMNDEQYNSAIMEIERL